MILGIIIGAIFGLAGSRTNVGNTLYTLAAARLSFLPKSKD